MHCLRHAKRQANTYVITAYSTFWMPWLYSRLETPKIQQGFTTQYSRPCLPSMKDVCLCAGCTQYTMTHAVCCTRLFFSAATKALSCTNAFENTSIVVGGHHVSRTYTKGTRDRSRFIRANQNQQIFQNERVKMLNFVFKNTRLEIYRSRFVQYRRCLGYKFTKILKERHGVPLSVNP